MSKNNKLCYATWVENYFANIAFKNSSEVLYIQYVFINFYIKLRLKPECGRRKSKYNAIYFVRTITALLTV